MKINQATIIEKLEAIIENVDHNEFIYGFMDAFYTAKSTITQTRQGGKRNVATIAGHVGLKNKLYYQPVAADDNIESVFEHRVADPAIAKHKIRFIIATDFVRFLAFDTKAQEHLNIDFAELASNYSFFLPLAGLEKALYFGENKADINAAEKMGRLFDLIRLNDNLTKPEDIHALNVFLTRLLFCFFAEDTGIFEKGQFTKAVQGCTNVDGSDLDQFLTDMFEVMNSKPGSKLRQKLPAHLTAFPYVNGGVFKANEPVPELGAKGRRILLECSNLDWSAINPDIFGSMFQAVIKPEHRSQLGQHYTSYSNIMKVIQPLFLESLHAEFEKQRSNAKGLKRLIARLSEIKVFDPACGSGNFLIVAYKELRMLEIEINQTLRYLNQSGIGDNNQSEMYMPNIHLNQFYGIEIDDFACQIARLSLYLAEHQLNLEWGKHFDETPAVLPLGKSGNVHSGNSLHLDWNEVCPKSKEDEVYLIGNPPFLGAVGRSDNQREDMKYTFCNLKSLGQLDYVACWFWKGAQYIKGTNSELAFVSTNSICQGEQVSTLWPSIFSLDLNIHLAYPSFPWSNNARDKAVVHVVIVGLSGKNKPCRLYRQIDKNWHVQNVANISPYLTEGNNTIVFPAPKPIVSGISPIIRGNMPTDGGNLFLNREEKDELIKIEPKAEKWIKRTLGSDEFINSKERWCLWLVDASQEEIDTMPEVKKRINKVKEMRLKSVKKATHRLAKTPHIFELTTQPKSGKYIIIPIASSQRRKYIPIDIISSDIISTNLTNMIPNGTLYEFAVITSTLHNDWMRLVGSRLKSDYRYSNKLVYNTFPWPEVTDEQREHIMKLAEEILLIRAEYVDKTLGELYDPLKMPADLFMAHRDLDLAVDKLYQDKPFKDSSERLSCLLERYEMLTAKS